MIYKVFIREYKEHSKDSTNMLGFVGKFFLEGSVKDYNTKNRHINKINKIK